MPKELFCMSWTFRSAAGFTSSEICTKPKVGGVRFAASHPEEGAHSHVHFDEKLHDSVVMVTQEKDGNFLVKGLLGIRHFPNTQSDACILRTDK
ncbi:UPF0687 protein C20orf27 like protein [Chelonia mydas]|uniref:Adipose-secreted signaling protein n=1 Tax=Chelonia mydas TaxID=8469 RepID=M7B210_CHEMY|nr:UPF0687 protein C20orf27 like protein [Chelonia mydas]